MPQYILFFHHPSGSLPPEQLQQIMEKFGRWTDSIRKQGKFVGSVGLRLDGARLVKMQNGKIVVDGPFAETKETIGGYITVNATNYDEAEKMAKDCPGLTASPDGLFSVEVREIAATHEPA